ncbi:MAG: S8 family serine peptidase [candidate division KSB1 bacterium]|nr:S8 family serine peptidase [candidate division KSB1 bacterium]
MRTRRYFWVLFLFLVPVCVWGQKQKIEKLEDMPVFNYEIPAKPSDFIQQKSGFDAFVDQVEADLKGVLQDYEINDKTTLKDIYGALITVALLEQDAERVLKWVEKRRELEEKPASKLMSGLNARILAQTWQEKNSYEPDQIRDAFRAKFKAVVDSLPWDVVQDQVESTKGAFEMMSPNVYIGVVQSQMDPAFEKTNSISGEAAKSLLNIRSALTLMYHLRSEIIETYDAYIQNNKVEKQNIWPDRNVVFDGTEGYSPVLIGIWDSGVDADVFGDQMWVNADEQPDGADHDGNGYVDDIHGIAFDLEEYYSPDLLYPLPPEQAERTSDMIAQTKGLQDLQAAVNSEEAQVLRKRLGSMPSEQVKPFLEDLMMFALYMHGTHVSGIAADGNPYARILGARITFDYRSIPAPPSVEQATRACENYMNTVRYFQEHGVRTVNMSWGWTFSEIEGMLEANGIGKDAEERREKTREIFTIYKDGLYNAIKSAPEILFVTAAGNSDNDVEFDQVIPSSFDLPNLLVAGAVDQAGEETSFTSFGERVTLHANGFEVDSYLPGGTRMKASGTSMASPNVVNLVGKLLAVNPDLTPAEVIDVIKAGVETSEDSRLFLINPKQSLNALVSD